VKRSEMIQDIASELIQGTNFIPWNTAQELAELVLKRIEKEGMVPNTYYREWDEERDDDKS
jgi:hypothetical protein